MTPDIVFMLPSACLSSCRTSSPSSRTSDSTLSSCCRLKLGTACALSRAGCEFTISYWIVCHHDDHQDNHKYADYCQIHVPPPSIHLRCHHKAPRVISVLAGFMAARRSRIPQGAVFHLRVGIGFVTRHFKSERRTRSVQSSILHPYG